MADVNILQGHELLQFFVDNPTLILGDGQILWLKDDSGTFKKGDGLTELQDLPFLGGGSQSLAQTLAIDNKTGAKDINIDGGQKLRDTDGTNFIDLHKDGTDIEIFTTETVKVNAAYFVVNGNNVETQNNKDASNGYVGLTLFGINFKNALGTITSLFTNANTAIRTYLWPDKSGTVALLDDLVSLFVTARNNTGIAITKGQLVYISGALGQNPTAALAKADVEVTSFDIGVAAFDIPINTNAQNNIITNGLLDGLNTSAFADGDLLYLSATIAGAFTNVAPSTPNFSQFVGFCLYSHVTQGKILIKTAIPIATNTTLSSSNKISPSSNAVKVWAMGLFQTIITYTTWGTFLHTATNKTTPVNADEIGIWNSVTGLLNRVSFSNLTAFFATVAYVDSRVVTSTVTDQTPVTGTTSNTIAYSIAIPANTILVSNILELCFRNRFVGTAGTKTTRIYFNTSSSLNGATLIGSYAATAGVLSVDMSRIIAIKSTTNTEVYNAGTALGLGSDIATSNAVTSYNGDWTAIQYLIIAIQNANTADSGLLSFLKLKK